MCFSRFKPFAALGSCLILVGCATPKLAMPTEHCSPMQGDKLVCNSKTIRFPEAGGMLCYYPHEIEPFLERCGQ